MIIGMKKKMYENGRFVIPIEFRKFYHFEDNEEVEIIATPEGILIRNPNYKMVKTEKE